MSGTRMQRNNSETPKTTKQKYIMLLKISINSFFVLKKSCSPTKNTHLQQQQQTKSKFTRKFYNVDLVLVSFSGKDFRLNLVVK